MQVLIRPKKTLGYLHIFVFFLLFALFQGFLLTFPFPGQLGEQLFIRAGYENTQGYTLFIPGFAAGLLAYAFYGRRRIQLLLHLRFFLLAFLALLIGLFQNIAPLLPLAMLLLGFCGGVCLLCGSLILRAHASARNLLPPIWCLLFVGQLCRGGLLYTADRFHIHLALGLCLIIAVGLFLATLQMAPFSWIATTNHLPNMQRAAGKGLWLTLLALCIISIPRGMALQAVLPSFNLSSLSLVGLCALGYLAALLLALFLPPHTAHVAGMYSAAALTGFSFLFYLFSQHMAVHPLWIILPLYFANGMLDVFFWTILCAQVERRPSPPAALGLAMMLAFFSLSLGSALAATLAAHGAPVTFICLLALSFVLGYLAALPTSGLRVLHDSIYEWLPMPTVSLFQPSLPCEPVLPLEPRLSYDAPTSSTRDMPASGMIQTFWQAAQNSTGAQQDDAVFHRDLRSEGAGAVDCPTCSRQETIPPSAGQPSPSKADAPRVQPPLTSKPIPPADCTTAPIASSDASADLPQALPCPTLIQLPKDVAYAQALAVLEPFGLTARETEIALLLFYSNSTHRQLAQKLHISENTAKTHVRNVYGKTGVNSRQQLIELLNEEQ